MHKFFNNQLWFFKTPKSPGLLIASRIPSYINTVDDALQWVSDNGRNGYNELIAIADDYKEKAERTFEPDLQKIYFNLEHEARERAEMVL